MTTGEAGSPLRRALPALLLSLAASASAAGEPHRCDTPALSVFPGESDLAPRVCEVAAATEARFTELGLPLDGPLELRLTGRITDAPDSCVALYDSAADRLEILTVDCLAEEHGGLGDFRDLPPEVFFDSLIVHELTHVALFRTGADLNRTAHEYLAYALQLDSLPQAHRDTVLAKTTLNHEVEVSEFDELLLAFNPLRFSVMAWTHFDRSPDKRALVAAILDRDVLFPSLDD